MSTWKVILATLTIFLAGIITGAVLVKQRPAPLPRQMGPGPAGVQNPMFATRAFVERLDREIGLSPDQRGRIETRLRETQHRTRQVILEELTPAQRKKFEMLSRRQLESRPFQTRPGLDDRRGDPRPFSMPPNERLPRRDRDIPSNNPPANPPPAEKF